MANSPSGTRGIWEDLGKYLLNSRHKPPQSVAISPTSVSRAREGPSPDTDGDKEMQNTLAEPPTHP